MADAPDCRLYLITPPRLDDLAGFSRQLSDAVSGGDLAAVQIRLKDVSGSALEETAPILLHILHRPGALLIPNCLPDLTPRLGWNGVQIFQHDARCAGACCLLGADPAVGVTCR